MSVRRLQEAQDVVAPRAAHVDVEIVDDWDGFGQRVTGSGSVILDRVEVDPDWVVPFDDSFDRPTPIGPLAQLLHAAIDLRFLLVPTRVLPAGHPAS